MVPDDPLLERPRALQLLPAADTSSAELPPPPLTPEQRFLSDGGVAHAKMMLEDFRTGGLTAAALERLLARCDAIGARVLLVGVPVTSVFRSTYTSEIDAGYRAYVAELVRTHGCRFVDYRGRLPDGLFLDVHHLSAEGGRQFSRLLARDVGADDGFTPRRGRCLPSRAPVPPWPAP